MQIIKLCYHQVMHYTHRVQLLQLYY